MIQPADVAPVSAAEHAAELAKALQSNIKPGAVRVSIGVCLAREIIAALKEGK